MRYLCLVVVPVIAAGAPAGTVYVNGQTGNDAWSGRCATWDGGTCGPKKTIQSGIDASAYGDEIIVADGVYRGDGNRDMSTNGKAIWLHSASGPATCIVDCEFQGRALTIDDGETPATIIEGFTFRNGQHASGGAVYCDADPTFRKCWFIDNVDLSDTLWGGGAVFSGNSSLVFEDCVFRQNQSTGRGGALYSSGGSVEIRGCRIEENYAARTGSAFYAAHGSVRAVNSIFVRNVNDLIWQNASDITLIHCSIMHNSGGVLTMDSHATASIYNTIVWSNGLPAIELDQYSEIALDGSLIDGGSDCITGSGSVLWGSGNVEAGPSLAFPFDVRLRPGSAGIDQGIVSIPGGLPAADADGNARVLDGDGDGIARPDIGAFESDPSRPTIAADHWILQPYHHVNVSTTDGVLLIRNAGGTPLEWNARVVAPLSSWLTVQPESGTSTGDVQAVALVVDAAELDIGDHDAAIEISAEGATNRLSIPVRLHVRTARRVPAGYASVAAAVTAASAGDLILLADGTHAGPNDRNITVDRTMFVRGENGAQFCRVDCEGDGWFLLGNPPFGGRITVEGLEVTGASDSALVLGSRLARTRVRGCVFRQNRADRGAAVHVSTSASSEFFDCVFGGNVADQTGGAVYFRGSIGIFVNCVFDRNTANLGGALYSGGRSEMRSINCTFAGNQALIDGAAATISGETHRPSFVNSVFWDNQSPTGYVLRGNSQVSGGRFVVDHCDVEGGQQAVLLEGDWQLEWRDGNIDADPIFAFDSDLHVVQQSPVIDAGIPDPVLAMTLHDLDARFRSIDGNADGIALPDLGAYEFDPSTVRLAHAPKSFEIVASESQPPPGGFTLRIRNTGGQTLRWQASVDADWLALAPTSGESAGEVNEIALALDTRALLRGFYAAEIRVWNVDDPAQSILVPVTLDLHGTLRVPQVFPTIQSAIDDARSGEIVLIASGIYRGEGNRALEVRDKAIAIRSSNGPGTCILDCQHAARAFDLVGHAVAGTFVEGLTFANGSAESGGAMFVGDQLTVRNCVFIGNEASVRGGAIAGGAADDAVVIDGCVFIENTAVEGGAMGALGIGVFSVRDSQFIGNTAEVGGAVRLTGGARFDLQRCVFDRNVAALRGGAVRLGLSSAALESCLFTRNEAGLEGGGVAAGNGAQLVLVNCTSWGNVAGTLGGGIHVTHNDACRLESCIFVESTAPAGGEISLGAGGTMEVTYCNILAGEFGVFVEPTADLEWGAGNIDADPRFVNASGGDLRLRAASTCINAGDPGRDPVPGALDLDRALRVWGHDGNGFPRVDMGSYEFGSHGVGDCNCDGSFDGGDIEAFFLALQSPPHWLQIHPNCNLLVADMNFDGAVDGADIDAFFELLGAQQ